MAHSTFRRIGDEEGTEAALKVGEIMETRGEFVGGISISKIQFFNCPIFFWGETFFIANLWGFGGVRKRTGTIYISPREGKFFFWGGFRMLEFFRLLFDANFHVKILTWTSRKWWMSCLFFLMKRALFKQWSNGLMD